MGGTYSVDLPLAAGKLLQIVIRSGYGHQVVSAASLIGRDNRVDIPVNDIDGAKFIEVTMENDFREKVLAITSTVLQGSQNISTALLFDTLVDRQLIRRSEKYGHIADGKDDYLAVYRFI
jgi:hypothetical protein